MVLVRETVAADWQALRGIRLAALAGAPDAFGTTYAEAAAYPEQEWRERAGPRNMFLAYVPEVSAAEPVGLAGGYQAGPGTVHLISMFVRPSARGRRVGEALIDAVTGWARDRNATSLHLWVTESNKPARVLYERCGFTLTGERGPLPSNPALSEVAMARPIRSP